MKNEGGFHRMSGSPTSRQYNQNQGTPNVGDPALRLSARLSLLMEPFETPQDQRIAEIWHWLGRPSNLIAFARQWDTLGDDTRASMEALADRIEKARTRNTGRDRPTSA